MDAIDSLQRDRYVDESGWIEYARLLRGRPQVKESMTDVAQKPAAGNRTQALESLGQSVWLDYLRRSLFTSGEFQRLIADDGLSGCWNSQCQRVRGHTSL